MKDLPDYYYLVEIKTNDASLVIAHVSRYAGDKQVFLSTQGTKTLVGTTPGEKTIYGPHQPGELFTDQQEALAYVKKHLTSRYRLLEDSLRSITQQLEKIKQFEQSTEKENT